MTRIPTLYPGEKISSIAASVVDEMQAQIYPQIVKTHALGPNHLGAKTCLSCGASQRADGSIPCGH